MFCFELTFQVQCSQVQKTFFFKAGYLKNRSDFKM